MIVLGSSQRLGFNLATLDKGAQQMEFEIPSWVARAKAEA
jgi:hypothetical protein